MKGYKMRLYAKNKDYTLYEGKMQEVLATFEENSVDSIVTDPPYELGFMNKGWDSSGIAYNVDMWKNCYKVLKPGGYLLAFGGTRTYHRITCAIEDAGFEIRDCIMWLYGSGFPKAQDIALMIDKSKGCSDRGHRIAVANRYHPDGTLEPNGDNLPTYEPRTEQSKKWQGWKTTLKPAYEPIIVARKPLENTYAENVLKYGVGGLNIDECRIEFNGDIPKVSGLGRKKENHTSYSIPSLEEKLVENPLGRFPANVILTYDETDKEEVCGGMPYTKSCGGETTAPDFRDTGRKSKEIIGIYKLSFGQVSNVERKKYDYISPQDEGSAARYFYCAKASKKDRDEGLNAFERKIECDRNIECYSANVPYNRSNQEKRNTHPTIKPVDLMQYLIRLVAPKGTEEKQTIVLDCFMGSGSTGKACMFENRERQANYHFIGVEMTEEYLPIAEARIDYALNKYEYDEEKERQENKEKGIQSIFDFIE